MLHESHNEGIATKRERAAALKRAQVAEISLEECEEARRSEGDAQVCLPPHLASPRLSFAPLA